MSQKQSKRRGASSADKITDSRFANFETDPRYALPSKRKSKTTIDKRFSRMLKDDDFIATAKVDRYGRKLKSDSRKKALQRLYQEEEEDEEAEDDDVVRRELERADAKYDPARGGGFSSSDDDSDSDEDGEDEEPEDQADTAPDMQRFRNEQTEVPTGEVTNRVAIVNLDWDHIQAVDLMALFSSFVPAGGRIEKISIYPSEFGKERMQREDLEGPPKDIFKKKKAGEDGENASEDSADESGEDDEVDDDEDDEAAKRDLIQEGNDEDFDSDALRTYQLDRLRYYYAIMVCSNKDTASKIYEATDGSEYLSSSNFMDLRFVPDDVTFDEDEPRDECESVPTNYKPVEFVTDALQHSKVKLTWDMHPEEKTRKEALRNAFSGSKDDIAENDLRAYLASDSEDEEAEEMGLPELPGKPGKPEEAVDEPKLSKKELARKKFREALGLGDEPAGKTSDSGPVGDMQITFTPALTEEAGGKKDAEEETTVEKYMRKERERKAKRKDQVKAKREGPHEEAESKVETEPQQDLGFDDPFFTSEEAQKASKSGLRKEERLKKREARELKEKEEASKRAQLQLLMADSDDEGTGRLNHFDMNDIMRAEKKRHKKKKGRKDVDDNGGLQEDFTMEVDDPRFKAVFEDHEFAIDPSNPKFKATSGMKKLLEEGRKKRKHDRGDEDGRPASGSKVKKVKAGHEDLSGLVSSIKRKSVSRK